MLASANCWGGYSHVTPIRAVLSGGPGCGKSSVLAEVEARGVPIIAEAARTILQSLGGMTMREERPHDFALAMASIEEAAFLGVDDMLGPMLFDRGLPDTVGFLWLEGLAVPPSIDSACRNLRYSGPIFWAEPWRAIYTQDDERTQSWEQALASADAVRRAWLHYGYILTLLPQASIAERAAFVLGLIRNERSNPPTPPTSPPFAPTAC